MDLPYVGAVDWLVVCCRCRMLIGQFYAVQVLLIGLPYRHVCWEIAETSNQDAAAECLPCLFLQFPDSAVKGHEHSTDTKVFQIFSREVTTSSISHGLSSLFVIAVFASLIPSY